MYEFASRLRYSEIGSDGRMTPTALITRMQDCGVFHCHSVGRGPAYWAENKCGWIVVSWQVVIERLPVFGERVITRTIPYRFHAFEGDRNYQTLVVPEEDPDAEPVLCAYTNSRWVWFDKALQRPARVPEAEIALFPLDPPLDMDCAPRRIELPETESEERRRIIITETDLDMNNHVNNLRYIDMARVYLPEHFEIRELRVEYIRQCRLGDILYPRVFLTEDTCYVSLESEERKPCAIIAFFRKPETA